MTDGGGFLYSQSYEYVRGLLEKYKQDKQSVGDEWREFFKNVDGDSVGDLSAQDVYALLSAAERSTPHNHTSGAHVAKHAACAGYGVNLARFIDAYRSFGAAVARLDPLDINNGKIDDYAILDPKYYNLDLSSEVNMGGELGLGTTNIGSVVQKIQELYCGSRSMEVAHISSIAERAWLTEAYENLPGNISDKDTKMAIYSDMLEVELFEQFLHVKFAGSKRFSIEGGETSMVVFEALVERLALLGFQEFVFGMPHRGRLNCLVKTVGKKYSYIISEFMDNPGMSSDIGVSGDVKYHLGASVERTLRNGRVITVSLTPNPSHLEAVDPVVLGRVKAKQVMHGMDKVVGVLSHGDASLSGQGVVYESLQLSRVNGYCTDGTVHLVVNNQIGFTAEPRDYSSSRYPTDIAKFIEVPIFHVNGDDPESAYLIAGLAADYRHKFKKDVIINVVCYRKYGHNEGDEPMFTQPVAYSKINSRPSPRQLYEQHLIDVGVMTREQADGITKSFKDFLALELSGHGDNDASLDWLAKHWSGVVYASDPFLTADTGIDADVAGSIADGLVKLPQGFTINPKLAKLLEHRVANIRDGGSSLDWGTAEWLAFGSLMGDGYSVRVSGQDSMRGTFSHRHAVLFDYNNNSMHRLFSPLEREGVRCDVFSSILSEYAVLGFEYGYSTVNPNALVVWEAQYGDFANGAQIIFDQFISSAELKWLRMSGLVVLLPHGYEGQGPEHSSARIERYLQLCAENNMRVVNCSTPANYFHALRRQLTLNIRKPLIVFSPKSLLRHKLAVSPMKDFVRPNEFKYVIGDEGSEAFKGSVHRVVLCSGKVCYDLLEARDKQSINNVAIVRIEQLYPLSEQHIMDELAHYPNMKEIVWCQEEPKNMGAWSYMLQYILKIAGARNAQYKYVGRKESSATSVGYHSVHAQQQVELIREALLSS